MARGIYPRPSLYERFDAAYLPEPMSGCWLWENKLDHKGYGRFKINGKGDRAHRVSWILHRGDIPLGMFVLHKCDVPCCVNPDHLFLGNHIVNMADMVQKGRQARGMRHGWSIHPDRCPRGQRHGSFLHPERVARGELNGGSKLTAAQVVGIKKSLACGVSSAQLGRDFSVSREAIGYIKRGTAWRHIDSPA